MAKRASCCYLNNSLCESCYHCEAEFTKRCDCSPTNKLCSDFPDAQFQIDGYVYPPYRKDRTKHGGGIMVFVKNDLITKRKQEFESDSVEIVSLELTISRKKWIIFSFYRPPKSNIANFFSELSKCVDKATRRYENVVLMGDTNIDTSEEKAIGMTKLSEFCDIFDLVNLSLVVHAKL